MNHTSMPERRIHGDEHQNEGFEETGEEFKNNICGGCKNKRPRTGGSKREFTYAELYAATEGFSMKNFVSEGGYGKVYKGELHGMKIAVKQHRNDNGSDIRAGDKEFKSEVDALSRVTHENVVVMLGSCSEGSHRLLVYEFVCNGSLNQHLHRKTQKNLNFFEHCRRPLSWENRIKVAMGAARGLLYLHDNNIIHRDMKPNNILLTHDFETLLGDFGLAITSEEKETSSEECVGDEDYVAPEYAEDGKLSTKTDVYSFGVVLLQLITGMRTTDRRRLGETRSLVEWARPLLREKRCGSVIDKRIREDHDCHQLYWMTRLAHSCLSKDPHKRLTMAKVVEALSHIAEGCGCNDKVKNCGYSYHKEASSLLISASAITQTQC